MSNEMARDILYSGDIRTVVETYMVLETHSDFWLAAKEIDVYCSIVNSCLNGINKDNRKFSKSIRVGLPYLEKHPNNAWIYIGSLVKKQWLMEVDGAYVFPPRFMQILKTLKTKGFFEYNVKLVSK